MIIDYSTRTGILYAKYQRLTLSRRERRYRTRIIQERHLPKDLQRELDEYVLQKRISYKRLYDDYNAVEPTLETVMLGVGRLVQAMRDTAISADVAADSLRRFLEIPKEVDNG